MSTTIKATGGGTFDPHGKGVYFLAAAPETHHKMREQIGHKVHYCLTAMNEIKSVSAEAKLVNVMDTGGSVFLDSGVFNLAMGHARAHNIHMDEALSLPPEEVDGFNDLLIRYVNFAQAHEDKLWGYVELDQGGRERKIETRARLEDEFGLSPIPVFHPVNDGWEYFDYLASRYDRICVGNIVKASPKYRDLLLYEIHRRWVNYPHLWIHVLGLSPNHRANTYRFSSCDSSSWVSALRWGMGRQPILTLGETLNNYYPEWMTPHVGGNTHEGTQIRSMCATSFVLYDEGRRQHFSDVETLGLYD
jgi:hypothetical protein